MNRPQLVGITGGIGAGKSTISMVFQTLGVPVYDADSRAKWLMNHSVNLKSAIEVLFGDASFTDGVLNRKYVSNQAFHRPELLAQLNALVHPEVEIDFHKWVSENPSAPYVLQEAALLFETKSYKKLNRVILVKAPEEIRIDRVLARDSQRTREEVNAIMARQMTDEQKEPFADIVLINDGKSLLIPQILKLHAQFSA